jgi:shikimate kinase
MAKGKTLLDLYNERLPLYQKYADITIDCQNKTIENIALEILDSFKKQ